MNCREFHDQLDDYLEGALPAAVQEAAGAHLHRCASCQRRLVRLHERRAALRGLDVPAPRPGFFEQALRQARQTAPARAALWPRLAGAALAAGVAAWIGFAFLLGTDTAHEAEPPAGVTLALHEVQTLQLAINAEQALPGTTLSIRLPAGVELRGFPGQREIRWKTDLAQGVNMLALPLVGTAVADGPLLARLEHADRSMEIRVPLRVNDPGRAELAVRFG